MSALPAPGCDDLAASLAAVVGAEHVLADPELRASYEVDCVGVRRGDALLVVRPADTAEVAAVVVACREVGVALVPQGGNTGLTGGGVPRGGEVLLSLRRLDRIEPVDVDAGQVTVGAGATLAAVQAAALASDMELAVDLGARDQATIGGMVGTNAGGTRVLRHGSMRAQVVGLEAVLADGGVVERLSGLLKDNVGYDLPGLLCGSEGTLAVVTRVRLRLVPRLSHRVTALVGVGNTSDALAVLRRLRPLASLDAAEIMWDDALALVQERVGLRSPLAGRHAVYLLVECTAMHDPTDELAQVLGACSAVEDVAVGQDAAGRAAIWALRHGHAESVVIGGNTVKLDVTLPLGRLAAFESRLRAVCARREPDAVPLLFGHVGDGNLHVNVLGVPPERTGELTDEVLTLFAAHGGSISAEHGIGVAKRAYVRLGRSAADVEAMRAIKHGLDPRGMLNPGVIFAENHSSKLR
jgi:FAD/FMN-containing dehydrogenase